MKYTNLKAFEKHLDGARPAHFSDVYLILGKERFVRKTATDQLVAALLAGKKNPELCSKSFEGDRISESVLNEELQSLSFFVDKQVLIIDQAESLSKAAMKALELYFERPNRSLCLVLSATAINHATNFYKKAEKTGVVLEFADEKPWEKEKTMTEWLVAKTASHNKRIDPQVCQHLIKQLGTDPALLHHELEKLLCYVDTRPTITIQDIAAICTSINSDTGWQLGEAIFRRDAATALRISKALIAEGTAFIALARQIRHQFQTQYQICTLLASGGTANDVSQQFPYMRGAILDRNIKLSQEYGLHRFKKGMQTIDQTELMAKSSVSNNDLLAELLIIKLIT